MRRTLLAVVTAASLIPALCLAMSISRDEALAEFDSSRTRILANLDADLTQAGADLIFFVVKPIRYHGKVMALLAELVAKSKTSAGLELTLSALDMLAKSSMPELRAHGELPRVEKFIDRGVNSKDPLLKLLAARVLSSLGPAYEAKKIDAYQNIFSAPPLQIDNGVQAFGADDIRFEMVGIIRKLLPQAKTDRRIRSIVRQGTEKYNLLAFFRSHIEDQRQPGTLAERSQIFDEWQKLMTQHK